MKDAFDTVPVGLIAGALALPLLFAFLFNLLPLLRRRRESRLRPGDADEPDYFTTVPREDDPHGLFATGYEPFLEWATAPQAPLIHLTGLSGAGKSSLLRAFLRPRLAAGPSSASKTTVLILSISTDPLAVLKESLLPLWKTKPDDYATITPLNALRQAAGQLGQNQRLIVAIDQFEKFFLLHTDTTATPEDAAPFAQSGVAPLRDFLQAFLSDPPAGVTLLLAYREDFHRLLEPLNLPARRERVNWMSLEPLPFTTAAAFLKNCPGLNVPRDRLDRVLREAAQQEGGRVVMRPIVANLLGLILQKMSVDPQFRRQNRDLLRQYVREALGDELALERARLLRALLTDFQKSPPRDTAELARAARINRSALDAHLASLSHAGLLRCLNPAEPDPARRTWRIAHDFLATLIERVLDGLHQSFWRVVRPRLAPAAAVFVAGLVCLQPWIERRRAIETLTDAGFTWNASELAATDAARSITRLEPLLPALRRLQPHTVDLSGCSSLQNVDALQGLTTINSLDLTNCHNLQNIDGLKDLVALTRLKLNYCSKLQNLNALENLTALDTIDLTGCYSLESLDGLLNLTSLESLDLTDCSCLENVDGLKNLTSLQSLHLAGCLSLEDIGGLRGLAALESLEITGCASLEDVDGLTGLTALESLDLTGCTSLQNVAGLKGLTKLTNLGLSDCFNLKNLDGLEGFTGLTSLDLTNCSALENIDALQNLTALESLNLTNCSTLKTIDALKGLKALVNLKLVSCENLENFDGLQGLPALTTLKVSYCDKLETCDAFHDLSALTTLDLTGCSGLQSIDGLKDLKTLTNLNLTSCPSVPNVDGLRGLTALTSLNLSYCFGLHNIDGLHDLKALTNLQLKYCYDLGNVDVLRGLTTLTNLDLSNCPKPPNVDALQGLTSLTTLDLTGCAGLQNIDGLKSLNTLTNLNLSGCMKLQNVDAITNLTSLTSLNLFGCQVPEKTWDALKQALPNTTITFPLPQ